ncbi:hypothetical protein ACH5RR_020557 [Cinchona calisaya]|uniref:Epidermal patterning factor-like protein n=1 Tax=Cinchona calisaya TaxID=153742 RepID=A0ABD2ZJT4_9GENT
MWIVEKGKGIGEGQWLVRLQLYSDEMDLTAGFCNFAGKRTTSSEWERAGFQVAFGLGPFRVSRLESGTRDLKSRSPLTGKADFYLQIQGVQTFETRNGVEMTTRVAVGGRKLLGGPGSSPPRCISKCGRCTPCRPVHVPVPPGTPVTAEYYPEAWRCKCGNKLYMP